MHFEIIFQFLAGGDDAPIATAQRVGTSMHVLVNTDRLVQLPPEQQYQVLMHECGHAIVTFYRLPVSNWNIAQDYVINELLKEHGCADKEL